MWWDVIIEYLENTVAKEFESSTVKKIMKVKNLQEAKRLAFNYKKMANLGKNVLNRSKFIRSLRNLDGKKLKKFMDTINEKTKNNKVFLDFSGRFQLSSSWVRIGIWRDDFTNKVDSEGARIAKSTGSLELIVENDQHKYYTYRFDHFQKAIWLAMLQAKGKNGTGAGSVLWNTIWFGKRRVKGLIKPKRVDFIKKRVEKNRPIVRPRKGKTLSQIQKQRNKQANKSLRGLAPREAAKVIAQRRLARMRGKR